MDVPVSMRSFRTSSSLASQGRLALRHPSNLCSRLITPLSQSIALTSFSLTLGVGGAFRLIIFPLVNLVSSLSLSFFMRRVGVSIVLVKLIDDRFATSDFSWLGEGGLVFSLGLEFSLTGPLIEWCPQRMSAMVVPRMRPIENALQSEFAIVYKSKSFLGSFTSNLFSEQKLCSTQLCIFTLAATDYLKNIF